MSTIDECMKRCPNYIDYPTAWAIQRERGTTLPHHPKCSSVPGHDPLSGPGFLCDCGAVEREWQRIREDMVVDREGMPPHSLSGLS